MCSAPQGEAPVCSPSPASPVLSAGCSWSAQGGCTPCPGQQSGWPGGTADRERPPVMPAASSPPSLLAATNIRASFVLLFQLTVCLFVCFLNSLLVIPCLIHLINSIIFSGRHPFRHFIHTQCLHLCFHPNRCCLLGHFIFVRVSVCAHVTGPLQARRRSTRKVETWTGYQAGV